MDEVLEGSMRGVEVNGREILVARQENQFYAFGEKCTIAEVRCLKGRWSKVW